MQLDSLLKSDRCTLVFGAIGDDKVRVTCQSWEDSRVILAEEALQRVAHLPRRPPGRVPERRAQRAGGRRLRPETKQRPFVPL
jgi:hypothetical protein